MEWLGYEVLIVLLSLAVAVRGDSIFSGAEHLLLPNLESGCMNTLKSEIDCDSKLLQRISFASAPDVLLPPELNSLCTEGCRVSLQNLHRLSESTCSDSSFALGGQNMTVAAMIDYYSYKLGLVCLRDSNTGDFCSDVEATWHISSMGNSATWPQHTSKIFPNTFERGWPDLVDDDGLPIDPYVNYTTRFLVAPDDVIPGNEATFRQYLEINIEKDGNPELNYGWEEPLEFDEFPLEIQCSPCFIDKFKYGMTSFWGDAFDEITEQVAVNMQRNCPGSDLALTPAHDLRGKGTDRSRDRESVLLQGCPQYHDVPFELEYGTAPPTCSSIALQFSVPGATVHALNELNCPTPIGNICLPLPCPITRVLDTVNTRAWLGAYQNFSLPQFMAWNPHVGTYVTTHEIVCVGPPGGLYLPVKINPANPTAFTTTASPAGPTGMGSIPNCGKYYSVAAGDNCYNIALNFSIMLTEFLDMNPSINNACTNLLYGFDYCVAKVQGSQSPPATTISSVPVSAPAPTTPGTISQCYQWYTTTTGDGCDTITVAYGITYAQLRSWNPYLNEQCSNLWADTAYCVQGPG